jgi:multifunctional methyltransferase subunit TRM112
MRLLTHNFLQSTVKGTTKGYPLKIEATAILVESTPMDDDDGLVRRMVSKVDYSALVGALQDIRNSCTSEDSLKDVALPSVDIPPEKPSNEEGMTELLLQSYHQILFNIHVLEGNLICPDTGRKFPIKDGIPNMILHEDEI